MRTWILLFVASLGTNVVVTLFQSKFTRLPTNCFASWNVTKSIELEDGPINCASMCGMEKENCRGFIQDEGTAICTLVNISSDVHCVEIPVPDQFPTNFRVQTPENQPFKSGIYLALPSAGKAYALPDLDLPGIVIPTQPDDLELAIPYKNGILGCIGNQRCWFWKFGTDIWDSFSSPRAKHFLGKLVLLSGKPVLIGGCTHGDNGCKAQDEVEVFDEEQNRWIPKAHLPKALRSFAAVVVNDGNKVIVAGGMASGVFFKEVYTFQLTANTWEPLEPLPEALCCAMGAQVTLPNERVGILILGGVQSSKLKDWAFFLDFNTYKWESVEDLRITGTNIYDGDAFMVGSHLIAVPNYEAVLRRPATRFLSRNLTDSGASWVVHHIDQFSLGKIAQVAFEIDVLKFN